MSWQQALRESERETTNRDFGEWLRQASPTWFWDWSHLLYTQRQLQRVTDGEINRLMIFEPPRHGKSELVTVRYPVWRMEREPGLNVIVGAYNQEHANRFSWLSRRIALQRELIERQAAIQEWRTDDGSLYRAVGMRAGITGIGGDLIVIDDPVKSRAEANSLTYQEDLWNAYRNDFYTRLEPGGAIILIMTRWAVNDLAGRILASEDGPNWTVVQLPAEAEEDDPLGRGPGEALCPARYPIDALQEIKTAIGDWAYAALYQQRPRPDEGAIVQGDWFEIVPKAPEAATRLRAWDFASTVPKITNSDPDYTVGSLIARKNGEFFIEDVIRRRMTPAQVKATVVETAKGDGKGVHIGLPLDPGSAGRAVADDLMSALRGYMVFTSSTQGDKVTRATPFLSAARQGKIKVLQAPWNAAWFEELVNFPVGAHDDQVDSASDAYNLLSKLQSRPQNVKLQFYAN